MTSPFVAVAPQALEIEQVDRQLGVGARGNSFALSSGVRPKNDVTFSTANRQRKTNTR